LGAALQENSDLTGAIASYNRAIEIRPDYAEAHSNLGNALQEKGDLPKAIKCFKRALKTKPDFISALVHKLHQQSFICDWDEIAADRDLIPELGVSTDSVAPFAMFALEDHPARHLKRSALYAKDKFRGRSTALPAVARPAQGPGRLRIGYFSGEFRVHPVMQLTVRMFELHNRSSFELQAFSFGPNKDDEMHQRLIKSFDSFHDVGDMTDEGIARLARSEDIDIAVDLTGYTQNNRSGILAYQAAPIQVSYLGYPGSMGADFIDYLIADSTLIPEKSQKFYSEKIVYMPDCYQVSDNSRPHPATDVTRAELGLPETGFVFCCFNNNYKITPREFDIWMRLLNQVEGSVLWLRRSNQWSEGNLKKEAQARGIDPDRVIFADKCGYSEYLARLTKADLFLDTFNYNAGAVANDALWCGLPVLTHQGQSYVARMASSLLTAIDMPELIATTEADYEQLALDLATTPKKLKSLKAKLARNKDNTPLFNTEQFTSNLETAYTEMYKRVVSGEKPEHLLVRGHEPHKIEAAASDPVIGPTKEQVDALVALYNQGQFEEVV
ncbi:MAG: tetratricopeptide repeat protein, partial [Pseudomonadales bacterium]|nr:tetratricopeptide repeat protein [Pseudomonadales bacterium]